MDPLSITTGVLAVLGACSTLSRTFAKIRSLRQAPAFLQALNNEISDLQLALLDINDFLTGAESAGISSPGTDREVQRLCSAILDQTRETLREVEVLVNDRIAKATGGDHSRVNFLPFIREHSRLTQLQGELRQARQRIISLFGHMGIRQGSKIEVLLTNVGLASNSIRSDMQASFESLEAGQIRIEKVMNDLMQAQSATSATPKPSSITQGLLSSTDETLTVGVIPLKSPSLHFRNQSSYQLPPRDLQAVFGALFVGYAAKPVLGSSQQQIPPQSGIEVTLFYIFPVWCLNWAISIYAQYTRLQGLKCSLAIRQIVPENHIIWDFIENGNIDGMRKVFSSGKVAVNAWSMNGHSFLHQAILTGNVESMDFLLQVGVDAFEKDQFGDSPCKLAWDRILAKRRTGVFRKKLETLFPKPNLEESYNFKLVHKAVLGLTDCPLWKAIDAEKGCISAKDSDGMTALGWAAYTGDARATELLLARGADCNLVVNNRRQTALHLAAATSQECLEIVLKAKPVIDAKTESSTTALTHAAVSSINALAKVRSLVNAGCELNHQDNTGLTALTRAIDKRNLEAADYLVECGAELGLYNNYNENALSHTIQHNFHSTLEILLARRQDHSRSILGFGTVMHLAAEFADVRTLQLLRAGGLQRRIIDVKNDEKLTPLDIAWQREDVDAEWREAFVDFLNSMDQDTPDMSHPTSDHGPKSAESPTARHDSVCYASAGEEFEDAVEQQD